MLASAVDSPQQRYLRLPLLVMVPFALMMSFPYVIFLPLVGFLMALYAASGKLAQLASGTVPIEQTNDVSAAHHVLHMELATQGFREGVERAEQRSGRPVDAKAKERIRTMENAMGILVRVLTVGRSCPS